MAEEDKILLTKEGVEELNKELRNLLDVEWPKVSEELQIARSQGDLSENADYDSARDEQAQVEARIKELEYKLEHSTIAESAGKGIASVGSTVVILYDDGDEEEFKIVGSLEADPLENKISNASPIGKAVIGHKKGEELEVESPNGSYTITLKDVK